MKGVHVFYVIVAFFAVAIVVSKIGSKRSYDWTPTFDKDSEEPFGCMLFDQVVQSSMGERYSVGEPLTPQEAHQDSSACRQAWLLVGLRMRPNPSEVHALLQMVRRGDRVLIATNSLGRYFADSLDTSLGGPAYDDGDYEASMRSHPDMGSVVWTDEDTYPRDVFQLREPLCEVTIFHYSDSLPSKVLARQEKEDGKDKGEPVAVDFKLGKGHLIVVSMPLLFTNYGMLHGQGAELLHRLLTQLGDRSVRRVTLNTQESEADKDNLAVLEYIRRQPPLNWAWWTALLLVALFIFTTARRRQRVIPVMTKQPNHMLEFVKLIGTLYSHQHNNEDLLAKKFRYTAEQLRRELQVDIADAAGDHHSAAVIARNTGQDPAALRQTIARLRTMVERQQPLSSKQMRQSIDSLNDMVAYTGRQTINSNPNKP